MRRIGSQTRATLDEAEMVVVGWLSHDDAVLDRKPEEGEKIEGLPGMGYFEIWVLNDDFAGFVIEIGGEGYEFVRNYSSHDGKILDNRP